MAINQSFTQGGRKGRRSGWDGQAEAQNVGVLGWKLSETDILSQCWKGTECAISCNGHVLSHQEDYMDIGHHRIIIIGAGPLLRPVGIQRNDN